MLIEAEVSLAVGQRISRYALWLRLRELGANPEALDREAAVGFCEGPLLHFLVDQGFGLSPRALRHLARAVARFDPQRPSPADRLALSDL